MVQKITRTDRPEASPPYHQPLQPLQPLQLNQPNPTQSTYST